MLGQQLTIKVIRLWHLSFTNIWQPLGLFTMKLSSVKEGWYYPTATVLQSGRQVSDSYPEAVQMSLGRCQCQIYGNIRLQYENGYSAEVC